MRIKIKKIDATTFDDYARNHPLRSYYQTSSYGNLMSKHGYLPIYIAAYDSSQTIVGASLILIKRLKGVKYGYAPRGFLIDFFDKDFVKLFTKKVRKFFYRRMYSFIKVNPEVMLSLVDDKTNTKTVNKLSHKLMEDLVRLNYMPLKNNLYFESLIPKYNAVIHLPSYSQKVLNKKIIDTLNFTENSGMRVIKSVENNIDAFIELVGNKNKDVYTNYFNSFHANDMLDVWFVEVDFTKYIETLQKAYTKEFKKNEKLNNEFYSEENNIELYNNKLESDQYLAHLNKEITIASKNINVGNNIGYVAGMLCVRYGDRISILKSYFKQDHFEEETNYFLYHNILMEYKNAGFKYIDFNGISGDFSESNPYKESSEFILNFNPKVLEYIGEFDLIVHQTIYAILWSTKAVHKEFEKDEKK